MKAAKVGADDFTAAGLGEAALGDLPREPLPAEPAAAACVQVGDEIRFAWPAQTVEARLTHHREGGDGLRAELTVCLGPAEIHWGQLNLASTSSREAVVKKLVRIDQGLPWGVMLEHVCRVGARMLRAGEPVVCMMPAPRPGAGRDLIPKLLVRHETNLLFADGGSGKSLLAICLAIAAGSGAGLPGIAPPLARVPVLYLDYESHLEEHQDRLAKLLAGAGMVDAPAIFYRAMTRPLAEDAPFIRTVISQHQVGLVILDSLTPGSGAEPDGADAAVRTLTALRSFTGVTRLALAHVSKAGAEQRTGPTKPFGSVFVWNLARSIWEVRSSQDEDTDELRVGLFHRKANGSRLLSHTALRFRFASDRILLAPIDLAQEPELAARASLTQQITMALAGGALTVDALAAQINAPSPESVAAKLRALKSRGTVIRLENDEQGRGRWGLPA
jgi:AAA domain-containing protein